MDGESTEVGNDLKVSAKDSGHAIGVFNYRPLVAELDHAIAGSSAPPNRRAVSLGPRPQHLVGREDLLAQVAAAFTTSSVPQVQVLCGLGGVGKTSVAVEYAYQYADSYGIVWQFNAEHAESLDGQIGELAAHLGLLDTPGAGDVAGSLRSYLINADRPWLLVLDNVVDAEVVQRLIPAAGPGHVLVTSQRTTWTGHARVRDVPILNRDVAIDYVLSSAHGGDADAAGRLVDALGGLPLAVDQAAAYLRVTGRPIQFYLDKLSALLKRPGRGKAVTETWNAAIGQLGTDSAALSLLRVLACCAPDAIPVRLLFPDNAPVPKNVRPAVAKRLAALVVDEFTVDEALIALREFSLITSPTDDDTVSIHRLVQAATLEALNEGERAEWRQATSRLIERATPKAPELPSTWPILAVLLAHIELVVPFEHACYLAAADGIGYKGNAHAALAMARRSHRARELVYGPDSEEALDARHRVAAWTGETGNATAARDQIVDLLLIEERILGPEHPSTLTTRHDLAYWTGRVENADSARDQFTELLSIYERVLGPEHPNTLTTRRNLAHWTDKAGDAAGARDQFAALLPICDRVLGPEHPHTLATRHKLAGCVGNAGDAAGARDLYAALLPIQQRVIGPEHPDALTTRYNFAHWTGMAGDAAGARDQFAALLPICERVLGWDNLTVVAERKAIAYWTKKAASVDEP
ncbi:MAG: tetratricopeptide repeat protein [Catenulispora sp.]|nr:tetratricopeptide repeat protein [Catenulispora sp.]